MTMYDQLLAQATTPSPTGSATDKLALVASLVRQQQQKPGGGNGNAGRKENKGGGPSKVSGRLVIKPRPVPRGYRPPLDKWKGIKMQPAAINSLQSAPGRLGALAARHAVSSFRPYAQQARIYNSGVRPAATPGSSYHQQGLAMDNGWLLSSAGSRARHWLLSHGWNSGASFGDPGHFTYRVTG